MGIDRIELYELIDKVEIIDGIRIRYHRAEWIINLKNVESEGFAFPLNRGKTLFQILIDSEAAALERRLILLPEIVESCLIHFYGYRGNSKDKAHEIANEYERDYTKSRGI